MTTAAPVIPDHPRQRDEAVAWMNRGHALLLAEHPAESLSAYAQAVALLRPLPLAENPSWANSLGAALMNHGQLLHRVHGLARADDALAAFDEAADTLRPLLNGVSGLSAFQSLGASSPWPRRNLAGTLLNRANLLLDLARFSAAAGAAREALALSAPHERADPTDADLALKARRALCDALGQLLATAHADQEALAAEAGDLAEDALALIRHWPQAGFALLATRFFRFGVQLYRLHQPHFLAEFISEHLPLGGPELRTIALEAVDQVLAEDRRIILIAGDPATERRLQTWRDLALLREQLAPASATR